MLLWCLPILPFIFTILLTSKASVHCAEDLQIQSLLGMCPNIFHLDLVTLLESGVTSQRAYRSLLVCNNMRISHINNTSKMFTMADIDFVEYILWCCPAVPVAYTLLYFSKAALPSMQQCFMSTVLQSRDPRDTAFLQGSLFLES